MSEEDDLRIVSVVVNGQQLPLTGTSLGINFAVDVKKEREDEAEIRELAAKMVEQQKAQLLKQQQQNAQLASRVGGQGQVIPNGAGGQANILNYMSRPAAGTPAASVPASTTTKASQNGPASNEDVCDEESKMGHFGWTSFNKTHIPYIFRTQEKYCAVRMIELKLLGKYLNCLHPDIYSSCTCVRSYYITEAEGRLLNEINQKHCDAQFGREYFTQRDLVVRLSDATKFYQFLDICYRKLISGNKVPSDKCGFIRINKESVVPYTVRNNEQVVPLFYFEGETENLKQKADYLSGWDLAYLKFCCKVQGIRNELFSSESVAVISLTDIKSYFPNGTEFEDYWPSKVVDSNLLLAQRNTGNNAINWTRQPTGPVPKIQPSPNTIAKVAPQSSQTQQKRNNNYNQIGGPMSGQNPNGAASRIHHTQQNQLNAAAVQALNGWGQTFPQGQNSIVPMIHSSAAIIAQAQAQNQRNLQANRSQISTIMANRQYPNFNNANLAMQSINCQQGQQPPPLVRSVGHNQNHMLNFASNEQRSVPAPAPAPVSISQTQNMDMSNPLSVWGTLDASQRELILKQIMLQNKNTTITQVPAAATAKQNVPSLIPMNQGRSNGSNLYNMTQEMRAVVQKVLSNPDLSTFIQTNASSQFVPFISPPVSPANSLTITPAPPSSHSPNPMRQKSVICSTSASRHTPPSSQEVIDLSSPRRLQQAVLQQHAASQQQQRYNQMQSRTNSSGSTAAGSPSNTASMHLQRAAAAAATAASQQNGVDSQRLCVIPEIPAASNHTPPYKVQKVYVSNNVKVPCVNMKAYTDSDQLMALTDFREYFFPNIPLESCKRFIEALNIEMYKGNRRQVQVLMENGRINSENCPLVRVHDIIKYMPQLRYMMRNTEQPPSKRSRVS